MGLVALENGLMENELVAADAEKGEVGSAGRYRMVEVEALQRSIGGAKMTGLEAKASRKL